MQACVLFGVPTALGDQGKLDPLELDILFVVSPCVDASN